MTPTAIVDPSPRPDATPRAPAQRADDGRFALALDASLRALLAPAERTEELAPPAEPVASAENAAPRQPKSPREADDAGDADAAEDGVVEGTAIVAVAVAPPPQAQPIAITAPTPILVAAPVVAPAVPAIDAAAPAPVDAIAPAPLPAVAPALATPPAPEFAAAPPLPLPVAPPPSETVAPVAPVPAPASEIAPETAAIVVAAPRPSPARTSVAADAAPPIEFELAEPTVATVALRDAAPPAPRPTLPAGPVAPATGIAAQLTPPTTPTQPTAPQADASAAGEAQGAPSVGARRTAELEAAPTKAPEIGAPPAPTDAAAAARAAAAPDAALRVARAAPHPAIAQVAVNVARAVSDGVDRITIKLNPPELGRVDVKIDIGVDGRIQAVFAAERGATLDILQRDARELERALQNAGLSADAGSLEFGLRDRSGDAPTRGEPGRAASRADDLDAEILVAPVPLPTVARAGGIDIRV